LRSPSIELRRARPLLGTLVEIRAAAACPAARLQAAIDAAFAAVEQVHRLMSLHDPASELSVLNRVAAQHALRVDAHTYAVLAAARRIAQKSEGAFDPSVAATLQEWGYLPASPPPVATAATAASWRDIELLEDRFVRFRRPLRIDLGGIAKGYAVDRAVETLRQAGVDTALVNADGDLRAYGEQAQVLYLRHPQHPSLGVHPLVLHNEALATSAIYLSRRQLATAGLATREVSPLLDPRSRQPYLGADSISVRAPECMSADALTKVIQFAARELAERVLATYGAHALEQQSLAEHDVRKQADDGQQPHTPMHDADPLVRHVIGDVVQPVPGHDQHGDARQHEEATAAVRAAVPALHRVYRQ